MAHLGFPSEFPPSKLIPLVEEVANLLKGRNETVSVAETVCSRSILLSNIMREDYSRGVLVGQSRHVRLLRARRQLRVPIGRCARTLLLSSLFISFDCRLLAQSTEIHVLDLSSYKQS